MSVGVLAEALQEGDAAVQQLRRSGVGLNYDIMRRSSAEYVLEHSETELQA